MIIRDSVATCAKGITGNCQSNVNATEWFWQNIIVVGIICATVLAIALVWMWKYYKWKADPYNAQNPKAQGIMELELKNQKLKQIAKLQDNLICYMNSKINRKEELSNNDSYIDELRKMIDKLTKNELNEENT